MDSLSLSSALPFLTAAVGSVLTIVWTNWRERRHARRLAYSTQATAFSLPSEHGFKDGLSVSYEGVSHSRLIYFEISTRNLSRFDDIAESTFLLEFSEAPTVLEYIQSSNPASVKWDINVHGTSLLVACGSLQPGDEAFLGLLLDGPKPKVRYRGDRRVRVVDENITPTPQFGDLHTGIMCLIGVVQSSLLIYYRPAFGDLLLKVVGGLLLLFSVLGSYLSFRDWYRARRRTRAKAAMKPK